MLCCSCFLASALDFNNKIYNADVNNNVVNIKVLLSVSSVLLPFFDARNMKGQVLQNFLLFFHAKENGPQ